jgi:fructose-1,6-bisphosphatase/sedoheptulose 1,7-bisphosphatase-like protein
MLVRANNSNSQMNNEVREGLLLRGGIVGYRLPSLYPATTLVHPNDTLVFATDGLKSDFLEGISFKGSAQQIADNRQTCSWHRRCVGVGGPL